MRPRQHSKHFIPKMTKLDNRDHIVRMLYKDVYGRSNSPSINMTVEFMSISTVMYHHDNTYVKVACDNFDNKRG